MFTLNQKEKIGIAVLAINHVIGLIGLTSHTYQSIFAALTALNLLVTFLVILYFHKKINKKFIALFLGVFSIGMIVEIVGVKTGLLFGEYYYTELLGLSLLGVPLIIGINWFLLVYIIGNFLTLSPLRHKVTLVFAGAFLMVFLDMLIEPFAVKHNLWVWQNSSNMPYLINYLAWFIISLILFTLYYKTNISKRNKVAALSFFILVLFFALNILIT